VKIVLYKTKSRGKRKQLRETRVFLFKEYIISAFDLFTGHFYPTSTVFRCQVKIKPLANQRNFHNQIPQLSIEMITNLILSIVIAGYEEKILGDENKN
jgi:hypothetical protein